MILNGPPAGLSGVLQERRGLVLIAKSTRMILLLLQQEKRRRTCRQMHLNRFVFFLAIQKCTTSQGTIEPGYTSITAVESQRRVINQAFRNSHKKSPKTGPQDVIGSKDKTRQKANQDGGNCTCFAVTLFTNDFSFITARLLLWQTVKHTRSLIDLRFIHLYSCDTKK